jgi:hemerythrin
MAFINWKESYSVGVKQLDSQHHRLIDLINQLFLLYTQNKFQEADVMTILQELEDYADEHFRTEEHYFDLYNYEKSEQHIAMHEAYRQKVADFKKSYQAEKNAETLFAINNFLNDWWTWHINNTDKEYTDFFHANGLK